TILRPLRYASAHKSICKISTSLVRMKRFATTLSRPKSDSYASTAATIFFVLTCSTGVARPVKVENACLLNAPSMIVSGLPPLVQIEDKTVFMRASVNASCVPSVRVPVPSAADGSAGEPATALDVLVLIHDRMEAVLRAVVSLPV